MTEKEIVALLKSINIKIESLQAQMVMFQEALQPDMEYTKVEEEVIKPDLTVIGDLMQDLTNVVIMAKTDKAVLTVKGGYQKWIAFSHMKAENKEFELGMLYSNIELLDTSKWILDKSWEKFKPQKRGG